MIKPYKGRFHVEWYPKTATTAYAFNDMVVILNTASGAGTLALATNSSTFLLGLIQQTVASTDADYAVASLVPVLVGDIDAEYIFDVSTGSAATTDIGEMIDLDDENSVDVNAYTKGQILVTRVISATQVIGKLNKGFGLEIPITQ